MRHLTRIVLTSLVVIATVASASAAQEAPKPAAPPAPEASAPAQKPAPEQETAKAGEKAKTPEQARTEEERAALAKAIRDAGNDRVALVRNLEEFLAKHPSTARKQEIYRAIIEASAQLKDRSTAIRYADLFLAAEPDDLNMLLFAVNQLEETQDTAELDRALAYADRIVARVTKLVNEPRPQQMDSSEWELERKKALMSIYFLRGRVFQKRRQYDRAGEDFTRSFEVLRAPQTAEKLGELAELRGDLDKATEYYVMAFAAPEDYGAPVDHERLRRKLGNVYRLRHNSEAGLGEAVLAAYDRLVAEENARKAADPQASRNAGRTNVYEFELRKLEGGSVTIGQFAGKVLVLNFWATWCGPCHVMEPFFQQVADRFRADPDVVFLGVNTEGDVELVKSFIEREKWKTPVVLDDGLALFYRLEGLPTLIMLDRKGNVAYRAAGFMPDGFVPTLTRKIEEARGSGTP